MYLNNFYTVIGLTKKTTSKFDFFKNIEVGDIIELKMDLKLYGRSRISTPYLILRNLRTKEEHTDHTKKVLNRLSFCNLEERKEIK